MSLTIILGALRVLWLQGLSATIGAWISPAMRLAIGVVVAGGVAIAAWQLRPSAGDPTGKAILDAAATRETITNANIDEERRDNAWLQEWENNTAAQRDAAAGAAADRVLWRADDPWLRAKRDAKGR